MPNRILYSELLQSKKLAACTPEEDRLYYRLILAADDFGRFYGEPDVVAAACFPRQLGLITVEEVETWLKGLDAHGLIELYQDSGDAYLQIVNSMQRVRDTAVSKFPPNPAESSRNSREVAASRGGNPPSPTPSTSPSPLSFERFWEIYPRRSAKKAARTAFDRACKRADLAAILAGTERYRDDPNRDPAYTKHPATWLNGDCWEDDPLPARPDRYGNTPTPEVEPPDLAVVE